MFLFLLTDIEALETFICHKAILKKFCYKTRYFEVKVNLFGLKAFIGPLFCEDK